MNDNDIDKGITLVSTRAKGIRTTIHQLNVSTLARWAETKDVSAAAKRATRIVQEIEPRYAQAIVNWFTAFTPLSWRSADKENEITAGFYYEPSLTTITKEQVVESKASPWNEFTPTSEPVPFVLVDEVDKFLARIQKRASQEKAIDDIPADLRKALISTVSEYKQAETA